MSENKSNEDNSDLLEAYYQAALTEGKSENIREFLEIAAQTQDDSSFKARLRCSNIELYNAAIKPTIAAQKLSIKEEVNSLIEVLDSTRFKTNMQRIFICDVLAKKYPSVLKRFSDDSTVICVSLSEDVNKWAWKQIRKGLFKDRSEAVEYALAQYVKNSK